MRIEPASQHVGAHVSGVDLRALDDETTQQLRSAWNEYGVLFFRDQHLTPDEHKAFARRFAEIDVNRFFKPVDGHPEVAEVLKEPDQLVNIGGAWHTDHSYDRIPARGSILLAREVPPTGGDTLFASVAAAYDALSPGLQRTLETLRVRHSNRHVFGEQSENAQGRGGRITTNDELVSDAVHPAVLHHPETGRKLLYVNIAFVRGFVDWTDEESRPLLHHLYEHVAQEQFTYRFQWAPGSIAMWDNRSTWHNAMNDYFGHRRLMHRITIAGVPLSGPVDELAA